MSRGIAVYHGAYGRACLYHLNRRMATHAHRESHVVLNVAGRVANVEVSGSLRQVRSGTAVAINPWEPHNFIPTDLECGHLLLVLYVDPAWLGRHCRLTGSIFGNPEIEIDAQIVTSMRRIVEIMCRGIVTDRFDGCLLELLAECVDRSRGDFVVEPRPAPPPRDKRLCRAIEIITAKQELELDLNQVARDAGLSRSHLFQLFRKETGLTPCLFRNTLRAERAVEWLTHSDRQATEIGVDLGFSSQSSFTRFFIDNVGLAPSEYRRALRLI